jgi:hypothetical protein
MPRVQVLEHVPADQVQEVLDGLRQQGCQADSVPEGSGLFTVRATCPDGDQPGQDAAQAGGDGG